MIVDHGEYFKDSDDERGCSGCRGKMGAELEKYAWEEEEEDDIEHPAPIHYLDGGEESTSIRCESCGRVMKRHGPYYDKTTEYVVTSESSVPMRIVASNGK